MNFYYLNPNSEGSRTYRDDCTINAFGVAFGTDYKSTVLFLKHARVIANKIQYGYIPSTKDEYTLSSNVIKIIEKVTNYYTPYYLKRQRISVATYAKQNPKGTHLIVVHGHLTLIHNGELIDHSDQGDKIVLTAGKVSKAKSMRALDTVLGSLGHDYKSTMETKTLTQRLEKIKRNRVGVPSIYELNGLVLKGLRFIDGDGDEVEVTGIAPRARKYNVKVQVVETGVNYRVGVSYIMNYADPKALSECYKLNASMRKKVA